MVLWELSIGYSQTLKVHLPTFWSKVKGTKRQTGSLISRTLTKDKFCQPNRLVIFIYKILRNKSDSP